MCSPLMPVFVVDPAKVYGAETIHLGTRKIVVASDHSLQPLHAAQESPHNCVNCGAPHEPVCSYCGTTA